MGADNSKLKVTRKEIPQFVQLQSKLRSHLYKRLHKREVKRKKIAMEILTTEETYVSYLTVLVHEYMGPLKAQKVIGNEELKSLFPGIEIIYQYNSKLLSQLQEKFEAYTPNTQIGPIFLTFSQFLKVYTTFVNRFEQSMDLYNQLSSKNKKFGKFLDKTREAEIKRKEEEQTQQLTSNSFLSLPSILIMPVQRLPRYVMLLQELLKYSTPFRHKDYQDLQKSLKSIKGVTDQVNETKRRVENLSRLTDINSRLDKNSIAKFELNLVSPSRLYSNEYSVICVDDNKKSYVFYLFNDLLLICKSFSRRDQIVAVVDLLKMTRFNQNKNAPQNESNFGFRADGIDYDNYRFAELKTLKAFMSQLKKSIIHVRGTIRGVQFLENKKSNKEKKKKQKIEKGNENGNGNGNGNRNEKEKEKEKVKPQAKGHTKSKSARKSFISRSKITKKEIEKGRNDTKTEKKISRKMSKIIEKEKKRGKEKEIVSDVKNRKQSIFMKILEKKPNENKETEKNTKELQKKATRRMTKREIKENQQKDKEITKMKNEKEKEEERKKREKEEERKKREKEEERKKRGKEEERKKKEKEKKIKEKEKLKKLKEKEKEKIQKLKEKEKLKKLKEKEKQKKIKDKAKKKKKK
ncbi:faciogenital dysplasia protein [Anaeramoeba flamelloides]|uniref:Faciogenital dysplasia protein n=1 Tax=Anaeramoeba flamelloides TaxID=1746091 RepID=A0ABQ8YZB6_9EUKA|nr:faciogenital dysplasia protein [Anaeramoeba flamelloides]